MFAYCLNSSPNCIDSDGKRAVVYKGDLVGYGGGGGVSFGLLDLIVSACAATATVIDTYRSRIQARVEAKSEKIYKSEKQDHHIVAQTAKKAAPARAILNEVYPDLGVEAPINKVLLSSKLHQSIHTNLYYGMVNFAIVTAYYAPSENQAQTTQNVDTALILLRALLLIMDESH